MLPRKKTGVKTGTFWILGYVELEKRGSIKPMEHPPPPLSPSPDPSLFNLDSEICPLIATQVEVNSLTKVNVVVKIN